MEKLDYRKALKNLYAPSAKEVAIVDVPPMNFLMVDGAGDPNTSQPFPQAVEALFAVSYTLKFAIKKGPSGIDYAVMPLEGLWWMDGPVGFDPSRKDLWKWTIMIAQPDPVMPDLFRAAAAQVREKKELPALSRIRFEAFDEGRCAQILHVGPFDAEGPSIEKVHRFAAENGYRLRGRHHEIYLSDMRRVAPGKMKTVVRHPVEKA